MADTVSMKNPGLPGDTEFDTVIYGSPPLAYPVPLNQYLIYAAPDPAYVTGRINVSAFANLGFQSNVLGMPREGLRFANAAARAASGPNVPARPPRPKRCWPRSPPASDSSVRKRPSGCSVSGRPGATVAKGRRRRSARRARSYTPFSGTDVFG